MKFVEVAGTKFEIKNGFLDLGLLEIKDMDEIIEHGVMMTPALSINGELKCSGRIPSKDELIKYLLGKVVPVDIPEKVPEEKEGENRIIKKQDNKSNIKKEIFRRQ